MASAPDLHAVPARDEPGGEVAPGGRETTGRPRTGPTGGRPSMALQTIRLIGRLRAHHVGRLAPFGLSIPEANALLHLQPGVSMPMSRLADLMAFDKSNLTTVMTKLERRGLVDRDGGATDRRMRLMRLTAAGAELRRAVDLELSRDSPLTQGLDDTDRRALDRILGRLGLDD